MFEHDEMITSVVLQEKELPKYKLINQLVNSLILKMTVGCWVYITGT